GRLARGKESVGLDALVMLTQYALGSKQPLPTSVGMSVDEIIQALETHPLSKTQHKLVAVDLKIHQHPDQRENLVQAAITQWKGGDNTALLALVTWLN